jgi:hypothetical protein
MSTGWPLPPAYSESMYVNRRPVRVLDASDRVPRTVTSQAAMEVFWVAS